MSASTPQIIARAETYDGIRAGIARLQDILDSPSCQAAQKDPVLGSALAALQTHRRSARVRSVLVLGLHHPADDPRLDCWDRGDTRGNRRLREISHELQHWLRWVHHDFSRPLSYHVENGGLFLKDAAVLSGLGVIGRNNLLVHPQWGPRIRLRAILIAGECRPTVGRERFSPCRTCPDLCRKACPQQAFADGNYSRPRCSEQMHADLKNKNAYGNDTPDSPGIGYCRACEVSCPVGACRCCVQRPARSV